MEEYEKLINERLTFINVSQNNLMYKAADIQAALYIKILESMDAYKELNGIFNTFYQPEFLRLTQGFIDDVLTIGKMNADYFNLMNSAKYAKTKALADDYLLERLGLNKNGSVKPSGFIDLFVNDTTVKQKVKTFTYKAQTSGKGLTYFKKGLSTILKDEKIVEKHVKTFAFDTYQQADATIQEKYAVELELQAAFYAGVAVSGSRKFCIERKGKVFTRQEIAAWAALPAWAGRTEPYEPFIDRGGYGCLDSINWITNKMALRRREDLEEIEGKLKVKA